MATWPSPNEQPEPGWNAPGTSGLLRLPPLPFEDVYLFRKLIDNSRLLRPAPRGAWRSYVRAFTHAVLLFAILLIILLPRYLNRAVAHERLIEEKRSLALEAERLEVEAREAAALSPARLEEWARSLELVDPAPGQMLALAPKPDRTLAARLPARARRETPPGAPTAR